MSELRIACFGQYILDKLYSLQLGHNQDITKILNLDSKKQFHISFIKKFAKQKGR